MTRFAFLSDEWMQEVRKLRREYQDRTYEGTAVPGLSVRMNLVITGVPFDPGRVEAHVDTSSGEPDIDVGHLDHPDLTVTTDYVTSKAIIVDGDSQAAMAAFLGGRVRVDGDITKLLNTGTAGLIGLDDPSGVEMSRRLQGLTE
ncbi:MAG: hypothetical protein ACRDY0_05900 [Acidimicrobiales bacterium]